MNQNLFEKASLLKNEIESDENVKKLKELDALLNNDEEVMKLCYKKDIAVTEYEDALRHFGENSEEALKAQKILYEAKLRLDENDLVKRYNLQYKKVRKIYDKINEEIFNPFN